MRPLHRPNIAPADQPLPPGVPATVPRRSLPLVRPRDQTSFVVYRGPSRFDGGPILGLVTSVSAGTAASRHSSNQKLGPMAQLSILRADEAPNVAKKSGHDESICGDCLLRSGRGGIRCYVNVAHGTSTTWKANAWRPVELIACANQLATLGLHLRLGAYGDPAALPEEVVATLVRLARGFTGYTHDWRRTRSAWLKPYAMASVETVGARARAEAKGWRTFRIARPTGRESNVLELEENEILCPAVADGVHCDDCRLCSGSRGAADGRKMIAVPVHGVHNKRHHKRGDSVQ